MFFLGFVLNLIKTLAINTDNGTLTDKGMWIYLADKAENGWSLALFGKHEEHLHILVTEHPADGLHRHTSLQRIEASERVSSRMVGIGLARFRQLADGDEVDTNTIRAQQWEKGISCLVLVFPV